jgi:hypothetical protein
MNLFNAGEVFVAVKNVENGRAMLEASRTMTQRAATLSGTPEFAAIVEQGKNAFLVTISQAEDICTKAGLAGASSRLLEMRLRAINSVAPTDISTLLAEMEHAIAEIFRDLRDIKLLSVDLARSGLLDNKDVMGAAVATAFPSAVSDIVEAGNCLAAECNTAAVFHLMRVAEWGLRASCVHFGFRQAKAVKKSEKIKYTPISHVDWETMLNQLQPYVDAKIAKTKRGPEKQALQEYWYPVLQDVRGIRDAWRNHVMHSRAEYNRDDAKAVLTHVDRLMRKLAEKISEV